MLLGRWCLLSRPHGAPLLIVIGDLRSRALPTQHRRYRSLHHMPPPSSPSLRGKASPPQGRAPPAPGGKLCRLVLDLLPHFLVPSSPTPGAGASAAAASELHRPGELCWRVSTSVASSPPGLATGKSRQLRTPSL
jgi:hypothetical protein